MRSERRSLKERYLKGLIRTNFTFVCCSPLQYTYNFLGLLSILFSTASIAVSLEIQLILYFSAFYYHLNVENQVLFCFFLF